MTVFRVTVDIQASPERVWLVMSGVECWHEWTASIESVKPLDPGGLVPGKRFKVRQPSAPPAVWTVTEVHDGKNFTWISRAPGILVTAFHQVEKIPSGTRALLEIRYGGLFGSVLGRLIGDMTQRYLNLEAAGLKSRSEQGAA